MKQNKNRLFTLDVSRGFTVLFIPFIHSWMMFGNDQAAHSSTASFLSFIAEWPGAPLFMLHMGIAFSYKHYLSVKELFNRVLFLLMSAYMLNILKFVLPASIDLLPQQFISDVEATGITSLLFIGDILHFAALVLPLLFITKKLPQYGVYALILLFIACFAAPFIWNTSPGYPGISPTQHLAALIGGKPPQAYFPFFPWVVYPIAGLSIGYFLQNHGSIFFLPLFFTGLALMIPALFIPSPAEETFYRTTPWKTLQHLGFVCAWLSAWYVLSRIFKYSRFFAFLNFLGKNITLIYLIQWPFICWLMPFVGYKTNTFMPTLLLSATITIVTIAITNAAINLRKSLWTNSS